jgi:hypothetical protein
MLYLFDLMRLINIRLLSPAPSTELVYFQVMKLLQVFTSKQSCSSWRSPGNWTLEAPAPELSLLLMNLVPALMVT